MKFPSNRDPEVYDVDEPYEEGSLFTIEHDFYEDGVTFVTLDCPAERLPNGGTRIFVYKGTVITVVKKAGGRS
jgi:hypothetical protein